MRSSGAAMRALVGIAACLSAVDGSKAEPRWGDEDEGHVCAIERVHTNETIEVFSSSVMDITGKNAMTIIKETHVKHVVVMIYAQWCPFSAKLMPIFSAAADRFPRNNVTFLKVNGHAVKRFGTQMLIRGYPTVMIFANGKPSNFFEGEKTLEGLTRFIERNTDASPRELPPPEHFRIVRPKKLFDWVLVLALGYLVLSLLIFPLCMRIRYGAVMLDAAAT
uniref:Thioredoxin domain-containing protein n=1 Tax=Lotharella oceanica TaxID=641309 RepID=A0A7S2TQ73_9EUKA